MPNTLDIGHIAQKLNELARDHPVGQLQSMRTSIKRLERQPSKDIFTVQTIHEGWAFHHGGRSELQFNIGHEYQDELRHGVALSFQLSQTLPNIDVLVPKAARLNEYLRMYPDRFADMRMWHYRDGERSDDYAVSAILPELVMPGVFIFLGKRQPAASIDFDTILNDFDRLLPLYLYVETGSEQRTDETPRQFSFHAGTNIRASSAAVTLAERELNITLRHNLLQASLCKHLIDEYGAGNVADEQPTGLGTKIDVVLRHQPDRYWYYEIKTASSARGCLREALGQILEYAYWPGAREATKLIVCGEGSLDDDAAAYLSQLRLRFHIPISYEQIVL